MFDSQWGSPQLSDDTPPGRVCIFLTEIRLDLPNLSIPVSRKFAHETANVIVLSHSLPGQRKCAWLQSSPPPVRGRGGPELTATNRAQSAPHLYVDGVTVSTAIT